MAPTSSQHTPAASRGVPTWLAAPLAGVFALGVTGVLTGLVAWLSWLGQQPIAGESQFLWRRLLDDPPWWIVGAPLVFAYLVYFLVVLFRQERPGRGIFLALVGGSLIFGVCSAVMIGFLPALHPIMWVIVGLFLVLIGLLLTVAQLALLGFLAYYMVLILWPKRENIGSIIGFFAIFLVGSVYLLLASALRPMFSWMVVFVPVLAMALFYVGMMYAKDSRSVHPVIAAFLGVLRCAVYAILSIVFLLPGCQTFDETVSYPKVLVLYDVSGSMTTKDDLPEPGQNPATLLTRQDKVIAFMTAVRQDANKQPMTPFMERLLKNTDLDLYRFGAMLDEKEVHRVKQGGTVSADLFKDWLKPSKANLKLPRDLPEDKLAQARIEAEDYVEKLVGGTNIGLSANTAAKLENNSYVQAIVIVSDGNSNQGGEDALQDFLTRVNDPRRPIPVFTVGVGEYRQPISIKIEDLLAPEVVRPDDKFPIRVPVVGTGLAGEDFKVTLEVTRVVLDETGKPTKRDATITLGPLPGKFKAVGENPQGTVEFEIDVQTLKKIRAGDDKAGDLEGRWEFIAKVQRDMREAFTDPEHVSEPVNVLVQKKELRILLFAGGPTSEYKFARTIFFREKMQKRVELSILLQSAIGVDHVDQDVDKDHTLIRFPDRRGEPKAGEKQYSLSEYDAIICFDPDWSQVSKEQLRVLKDWVEKDGGGVVFVAGPVNTYQLARPGGMDLSSLITIFPVMPKDSRLHGLNLGNPEATHDSTRPYVLHFTPAAANYDFIKLDEKGDGPTAGWDSFFWAGAAPEPGRNPKRGFFNYYPVAKLKPDSAVIATFGGPKSTYFEDYDGTQKEQPFIVSMRYGGGKTVYLGAGEFWRLRPKEGFHERFWVKLARYVAAGGAMRKQFGTIYLPRVANVGTINFEAKLRDERSEPLAANSHPTFFVRKILKEGDEAKAEKYELKPRSADETEGFFTGSVKIREEGKYEFKVLIPGTTESIRQELIVRKPDPEKDNVRNNFEYLYQLASEAPKVLAGLPPDVRKEVQAKLTAPANAKDAARLFFTLQTADSITKCLKQIEPKRVRVKGPLYDLWDRGVFHPDHPEWARHAPTLNACTVIWGSLFAIGAFGCGILAPLRQFLFSGLFAAATWLMAGIAFVSSFFVDWPDLEINFSFVLIAVVAILSLEWLTRKLLKLA